MTLNECYNGNTLHGILNGVRVSSQRMLLEKGLPIESEKFTWRLGTGIISTLSDGMDTMDTTEKTQLMGIDVEPDCHNPWNAQLLYDVTEWRTIG